MHPKPQRSDHRQVIWWIATAVASDPALEALDLDVHVEQLANGLTVVIREDHRAPVVASTLLYQVGAADQPEEYRGLAHLTEHLMFEGSPNAPGRAYEEWLADAGGTCNAWTSQDWTVFNAQVPPGALDLLLFLESDRMGWLSESLSEEAIETQKRIVRSERLERSAENAVRIRAMVSRLLWPEEHPYHWPAAGLPGDSAANNLEQARAFLGRWYRPRSAVLSLVGDIDTEEALASVHTFFDQVTPALLSSRRPYPPMVRRDEEERWTYIETLSDPVLVLGWNTVPEGHPDAAALTLLGELLASGRGTRLVEELVYEEQLALRVSAQAHHRRLGGEFLIDARLPEGELLPALRAIDKELTRLRQEGPSQEELDRVVSRRRAVYLRSTENLATISETLARCVASRGEVDCMSRELEALLQVTPEKIRYVMNHYLGPGRLAISVVPAQSAEWALPTSVEAW